VKARTMPIQMNVLGFIPQIYNIPLTPRPLRLHTP
jgi:hypothetical protein